MSTTLDFSGYSLTKLDGFQLQGFVTKIQQFGSLEILNLANCDLNNLDKNLFRQLMATIACFNHLITLNLDRNYLNVDSKRLNLLYQCLKNSPKLQSIIIKPFSRSDLKYIEIFWEKKRIKPLLIEDFYILFSFPMLRAYKIEAADLYIMSVKEMNEMVATLVKYNLLDFNLLYEPSAARGRPETECPNIKNLIDYRLSAQTNNPFPPHLCEIIEFFDTLPAMQQILRYSEHTKQFIFDCRQIEVAGCDYLAVYLKQNSTRLFSNELKICIELPEYPITQFAAELFSKLQTTYPYLIELTNLNTENSITIHSDPNPDESEKTMKLIELYL